MKRMKVINSNNIFEELIQKSAGVRKSGRYNYEFENTKEQRIYETPDPNYETKGIELEGESDDENDEINIANSNKSSGIFVKNEKANKLPSRTQANFNKESLDNKEDENQSLFSDPNHLNKELWKENFKAIKTSYLKLMGEANKQTMRPGQYNFGDSDEEQDNHVTPEIKRPISHKNPEKPYKSLGQQIIDDTANQYEKFKNAFKEEDPAPIIISSPVKSKKRDEEAKQNLIRNDDGDVKEISMNNPRYGKINSSIPCIDDNLMRTNSNDKSINIEVDSFNWEEEEFKKSQAKINLAQYDDKDDQYEDDFENEVKSKESTPKKSKLSDKKNVIDKKIKEKFTNEEEQFMND